MNDISSLSVEGAVRSANPFAIVLGEARPDLIRDEVLGEIFAASVATRGGHPALTDAMRRLSYDEVFAAAGKQARGLVLSSVGPGDMVGLWMPRGIDLLVAQIAITLSGAAWVPFDAEAPVERIATCLNDAAAKGIVTCAEWQGRAAATERQVWAPAELAALDDGVAVPARAPGLTKDHPAYLIYTSGSTGTPKAIVISHRNICHFLRSGNAFYGMAPEDIVFQGASVAFDLSMEEIWTPYLVGATLFVASPEMMGDAEKLPEILSTAGVTVIDTVPTLLGILPADVPSLRLILLGGEALPPAIVQKWSKPGRRILNTYGPTEATVVATATEVKPGEVVTIGKPIANYSAYVVSEDIKLIGPGEQGELLIGGPGVAKGYHGRPELTAEKFIANPFGGDDPVLYRSGDAVSLDAAGNIVFHGRIDDQIKIRGFRVELGEIESKLAEEPGVNQAAVVLRQDDEIERLVAFIVGEPGVAVEGAVLRAALRDKLPPYMVPAHFEAVGSLPRMVSGKVDRKMLKAAPLTAPAAAGEQEPPRNATEAALLEAAKRVLGAQSLPFDADFFVDLGGHSLLAARFISIMRETPTYAGITLQDVYGARTLRGMAALLDERGMAVAEDLSFTPPPFLRRFLCGLAQAAVLPVIIGLATAQWLGIFVTYMLISGEDLSLIGQVFALLGVYVAITIVTGLIAIALKWIVLGKTKPGVYPLWGVYYFRWWFAARVAGLVHIKWLQGTPVMRFYWRLLGAKVGRDVIISDYEAGAIDLIEIGEGTALGSKTTFANGEAVGDKLILGRITLGRDIYAGSSVVFGHGSVIGDHAEIGDLTAIPAGTQVGKAEIWDGSPARKTGMVDLDSLPPQAEASPQRRALMTVFYVFMLVVLPPISLLPIFPAFWLFDQIDDWIASWSDVSYLWYLPILTWPTAMGLIAFTVLLMAGLRWVILPRVTSGSWSIHSGFYARKWTVALATEVTLETLSSLFATIYMRFWYRLMGASIGKGAEISTNLSGRYDLTGIGAGNFIADEVVFGDEDMRRGYMRLDMTRTGDQVFVGNDAVVPPGAVIPDRVLIGIKSKPPANELMQPGDTWFGSPPIRLPTRQKVDLGADWTYKPSLGKQLARGAFEALHTSFPAMLFITFGTIAVDLVLQQKIFDRDWVGLVVDFVWVAMLIAVVQALICAAMKWLLMGVYKPVMKPMWSFWAMRTEAVAVLYWGLGGKVLFDYLRGTPFLPWFLRLFGAKYGRGVWLDSTDITEFDCIKVGDFCTVNAHSALQTHLYEDRVMKVGRVTLGKGVCVGAGATVLYDTHVGDYAQIGLLTVIMKGENLPAHTRWEGAPAVPAKAVAAH
ncbi:amino acid adenylation domain-containing protein [Bosea caraganae]|uniref:Amino acid adenylation domain-containing protein n=1 Tax=Bosea caraganae TaxID=2763117 RepID=A0A370KYL5_9HYPH|nr:Pls/PosA family non-ribosomal peptide synthetase [Bosea caraganae]RDJ20080.1 amino acid adenylation domain-containing protein [Bosea caraganae]RDJ25954.1 amino acid adenylation domain-containing protein [Bosea caraganae]